MRKAAAFTRGAREYSFEELLSQTRKVAGHLQNNLGVKPGDRVGLWLKNCPEFIPACFGILQAGGVVVLINNFLKPRPRSAYILADANADLIITDATLARRNASIGGIEAGRLKCVQVEQFEGLVATTVRATDRSEADLSVIVYTSGTTGKPKGAMLSHGNLLHNVESCRLVLQCVTDDRMVVLLPM